MQPMGFMGVMGMMSLSWFACFIALMVPIRPMLPIRNEPTDRALRLGANKHLRHAAQIRILPRVRVHRFDPLGKGVPS